MWLLFCVIIVSEESKEKLKYIEYRVGGIDYEI